MYITKLCACCGKTYQGYVVNKNSEGWAGICASCNTKIVQYDRLKNKPKGFILGKDKVSYINKHPNIKEYICV